MKPTSCSVYRPVWPHLVFDLGSQNFYQSLCWVFPTALGPGSNQRPFECHFVVQLGTTSIQAHSVPKTTGTTIFSTLFRFVIQEPLGTLSSGCLSRFKTDKKTDVVCMVEAMGIEPLSSMVIIISITYKTAHVRNEVTMLSFFQKQSSLVLKQMNFLPRIFTVYRIPSPPPFSDGALLASVTLSISNCLPLVHIISRAVERLLWAHFFATLPQNSSFFSPLTPSHNSKAAKI